MNEPEANLSDPSMRVVICIGLPGAGKSTWLSNHAANEPGQSSPVLSSDEIRRLLSDDVNNQSIHREVFATLRDLLRRRLILRRPVTYIDATNLAPWERKPYIVLANLYGADAEALFFDTPIETCIVRSKSRDRVVPEDVIRMLAGRLNSPTLAEGFQKIERITS